MISKEDVKELRRYRHLIAAMIDLSQGYFTPVHALRQIECFKTNTPSYCEWYIHMGIRMLEDGRRVVEDEDVLRVNRNVIKHAFVTRRLRRNAIKRCVAIVDSNIGGNESLMASWM
jgi:hypothetical protein